MDSLKIAISPYQDLAMFVNAKTKNFAKDAGFNVDFVTFTWQEIMPAMLSDKSINVGCVSLAEFLIKKDAINKNVSDPLIFIYPLYVFKGGAFLTFNDDVPELTEDSIKNADIVKSFLSFTIGAQKDSLFDLLIYNLAKKYKVNNLSVKNASFYSGFYALKDGALDIANGGLTEVNQVLLEGGRSVLDMSTGGVFDVTGLVVRKSFLKEHNKLLKKLIRTWFVCVNYVLSNLRNNTKDSLEYLRMHAVTEYTLDSYKQAIDQEFFPKTVEETQNTILAKNAKYDYRALIKLTGTDTKYVDLLHF